MIYREQWTQSIFECLTTAQPVYYGSDPSDAKVEVAMLDLESIQFEHWLTGDSFMGTVTAPQGDEERACKARVSYAFKAANPELNSWLDLGDDGKPAVIHITL